jgi:hypothetical protein
VLLNNFLYSHIPIPKILHAGFNDDENFTELKCVQLQKVQREALTFDQPLLWMLESLYEQLELS